MRKFLITAAILAGLWPAAAHATEYEFNESGPAAFTVCGNVRGPYCITYGTQEIAVALQVYAPIDTSFYTGSLSFNIAGDDPLALIGQGYGSVTGMTGVQADGTITVSGLAQGDLFLVDGQVQGGTWSLSASTPQFATVAASSDGSASLSVAGALPLTGGNFLPLSGAWTCTNCDPTETPLPATLPLFATGLGALGLLRWRCRRRSPTYGHVV